ncbi:SusC/RagA family TonB-linked outer membrane protein [Mucilaginibacter terrae]|uniref:TonB-linked SusC/RagA family outer membrane protein n=1 Tax=Mucilaginibacter terrae TaxID=1955052 RepID=A0ABU3GRE9_9SPHI|nr:SusC/RagA family TonB-linked outer membrane protein [Mucilaginibacter terrae]MDT3402349.1 TonB-linked SusC/RagA family outer membrane protein [Mucilaginibacter terrae]
MKLTFMLIFACLLQVSAASYGQRINLNEKNISFDKLLKKLEKQSGYSILYNTNILTDIPLVNVDIRQATITEVLDRCLLNKPLDYVIIDKSIVIQRKPGMPVGKPADMLIKGQVVDEKNLPLPGVTIKLKDGNNVWVTDADGRFTALVNGKDPVLIFSHVSFQAQEVKAMDLIRMAKDDQAVVIMKAVTSVLDQVQVIAYGQTSKRLNPGNVVSITAKDIEHNPVTNVLEALQGRVPGMFIQQNSGVVGGSFDIRIRNAKNFTSQSPLYTSNQPQPLIILDGVSIPSGTLPQLLTGASGAALSFAGGNALNYLNPNDVESIEVLKDADATAIYGARGAYGVIIINTKKAKPGPPSLNVNVYSGVSVKGTAPQLLNTPSYLDMRREAFRNDGTNPGSFDNDLNGQYELNKYTDWKKFFIGNAALNTKADANYSGGSELMGYKINAGYHNQQNVIRGKGSARDGEVGLSLNIRTPDRKLNLGIQANYANAINDMLSYNLDRLLLTAPNAPDVLLPDGSINWALADNPARLLQTIYRNKVSNLQASANLNYNLLPGLSLTGTAAYNEQNSNELSATPSTYFPPTAAFAQSTASIFNHYNIRSITVTSYAHYNNRLGKGDLDVKVGGEINDRLALTNSISGSNFSSDALISNPAAGSNPPTVTYNSIPFRSLGLFAVIKYTWDNKYIIDLNGRRDGSSRFGPDRRFGNFGSVGAAWIISEERWFKSVLPFISFTKLRGSTGTVGGDAISDYAWLNSYTVLANGYAGKGSVQNQLLANPDLAWEKNRRSEIGLELGLFKDRLVLEADYYYNKASNQLLAQPLPSTTGFKTFAINSDAVIQNTGWEAIVSAKVLTTGKLHWNTRFNVTLPKSKLLRLPNYPTGTLNNFVLGRSTSGILLYDYAGVNPATGNYQFTNAAGLKADYALSGSGSLNSAKDKTAFVDLNPKFYGGLENTFSYNRLSLSFFFTFTKRTGQSFLGQQTIYPGTLMTNIPLSVYDQRWQKPGGVTKVPRLSAGILAASSQSFFNQSTGAYEDATYARLQNLNFSWELPPLLARKIGSKRASVFLQGQNLLTISKYGDVDPESLSASRLAPLKIFTAGFNVTF